MDSDPGPVILLMKPLLRVPVTLLLRVAQNESPAKLARGPTELRCRFHTTPFGPEPGLGPQFRFPGNIRVSFHVANSKESGDPDPARSPVE